MKIAEENVDFVMGFICQERLSDLPDLLHFTPGTQSALPPDLPQCLLSLLTCVILTGVKLSENTDQYSQTYTTPEQAIKEKGSDVIIVGRGIMESEDPVNTAIAYKNAAYKAYQETLSQQS